MSSQAAGLGFMNEWPFRPKEGDNADPRRYPDRPEAVWYELVGWPIGQLLIDGVLVEDQPAGLVAPKKSLKTNSSVDLAVSLATGERFLGHYSVAEPKRMAMFDLWFALIPRSGNRTRATTSAPPSVSPATPGPVPGRGSLAPRVGSGCGGGTRRVRL